MLIANTEFGGECFCGTSTDQLRSAPREDCNVPCKGSSSEACGGSSRLSVYSSGKPGPITNPGDGTLTHYAGCWVDSVGARTLPVEIELAGKTTVAACAAACREKGYDHAGVEYASGMFYSSQMMRCYPRGDMNADDLSTECYCGQSTSNSIDGIKHQDAFGTPDVSGCNMLCKGNLQEYCGGSNRLNVYYLPPIGQSPTFSVPPTASSSTKTSQTASSSPTASTSPHEIFTNGGFEKVSVIESFNDKNNLAYNWTVTTTPSYSQGNLVGTSGAKTSLAHTGGRAFIITSGSRQQSNDTHSLCVSQTAYHPDAGIYNISMYIGRGESSDSSKSLSFSVLVDGGQLAMGDVCIPSQNQCDVLNVGGQKGFKFYSWQVALDTASIGNHTLSVCGIFGGDTQDIFVVDDISVIAP
jgi:hypothetical protein